MQAVNFEETLDTILRRDSRYHREAYLFVREALDHTHKRVRKSGKSATRHVTGQELLVGIREFGLDQFGPMTLMVLTEWGIHRCEDFGEIVFNMVESGLLGKTEQDSRADFKGGYDFQKTFRQPFVPKNQPAPSGKSKRNPATA